MFIYEWVTSKSIARNTPKPSNHLKRRSKPLKLTTTKAMRSFAKPTHWCKPTVPARQRKSTTFCKRSFQNRSTPQPLCWPLHKAPTEVVIWMKPQNDSPKFANRTTSLHRPKPLIGWPEFTSLKTNPTKPSRSPKSKSTRAQKASTRSN